jgi:hypothetical protein
MKNLYHKIAVASVCTALSFALTANKEAKAAMFTLSPSADFAIINRNQYSSNGLVRITPGSEIRSLYEFDISNLPFLPPNRFFILSIHVATNRFYPASYLNLSGYVGNGIPDISDFDLGQELNTIFSQDLFSDRINLDVTSFVDQIRDTNNAFVGFNFRTAYDSETQLSEPSLVVYSGNPDSEPVPEPTTVFGTALALSLGLRRRLKRKSLNQKNKTTPQS